MVELEGSESYVIICRDGRNRDRKVESRVGKEIKSDKKQLDINLSKKMQAATSSAQLHDVKRL